MLGPFHHTAGRPSGLGALVTLCLCALAALVVVGDLAAQPTASAPSTFIENAGQWSSRAGYRMQLGALAVWLEDDAAWLDVAVGGRGHALRQRFDGGRAARIAPSGAGPTFSFFGATSRAARSFAAITYHDIYPGIDARYYSDTSGLKYDVVVAPHGELARVRIRYDGADAVRLGRDGSLRIATSVGELREAPPLSYQVIDGRRIIVPSAFVLDERGIGFRVGRHDRSRPLVIDPSLAFSSYIGGGADDTGRGIAVDAAANVYIAGSTHSADIPTTPGAYSRQPDRANSLDLFVVKLDPTMSVVLYGSYIGGTGTDELGAIRVRSDGAIVLAGTTSSTDFPVTANAEQRTLRGGTDGFVSVIAPDGRTLAASTYFGGSGLDRIEDLALGGARGDQPFVVGTTTSSDLPRTTGAAFPTALGGEDAFAARFAADLSTDASATRYATYLGGAASDRATGLALAPGGALSITGSTSSEDFPVTAGAAQTANLGGGDGFIARLRFDGSVLEYGTYLGGTSIDRPLDIALDARGNQYVAGLTFSTDLPATTADAPGTWFVARIDSSSGAIGYCRYVGPVHDGAAWTIQASASGEAHVAGSTNSAVFPTTADAVRRGPRGALDLAFVRLSADGSQILHASVIGGEGDDVPSHQSHLTRLGDLYVTGRTVSAQFPVTPNALDTILNTNRSTARSDAFALAFRFAARPTIQSPVRVEFDTVRCDTIGRDTFDVVNAGDAELVIRANRFSLASGRFVLEQPDPANTDIRIPPGGRQRYIIRFRAPQPGGAVDTLLIFSNDSLRDPLRVAVRGFRSSPAFQGLASSYALGRVPACSDTAIDRTIRFVNSGNDAATVVEARMARGGAFSITSPTRFPLQIGVGDDGVFTVRFRPSFAGTFRDTLVVTIAGCPSPVRVEVTAIADSVGFDIVESEVTFPPLAACTGASDTTITLRATGATDLSVSLDAVPGAGFSVAAPLPILVRAGTSVSVPIRFSPPAGPVTATATLRLRSAGACSRVDSVVLHGERRPGAALQVPDTIRFGTLALCAGGDSTVGVEILNRSNAPVDLGSATTTSPFIVDNAGELPATLAPGEPVVLRVRFAPVAPGAAGGVLALAIDAGGCRDTLRIPISGAAERPVVTPADTAITVATLPACVGDDTLSVELRNLSGVPVEIDSVGSSDGISHLAPALTFTIAPGGTATTWLRFAPRQSGPALERLVFYTRGCRDSIVVRVIGRKEGAVVVALPQSITLDPLLSCSIDTVITTQVRLRNQGDFPVRVQQAAIAGSAAFSIANDPSGSEIAPAAEIVVDVTFVPTAAGVLTGSLQVVLEPCGEVVSVALEASVIEASLASDGVNFGSTAVGSPVTAELVVVNELPMAVSIASIGPPPIPFSFVTPPSIPIALGAGETLRVAMRFDPTVAGSYSPTMELTVDAPCAFTTNIALAAIALGVGDTITACLDDREAGLAGDVVELFVATEAHAPLAVGSSIEYSIAYDAARLEFLDAPGAAPIGSSDPPGVVRLRVDDPVFGATHLRLRFRVLSADGLASVRVDSAVVIGADLRVEPCADSATVRVSNRCVITGVALGRYENLIEPSRPNPARGAAEIVFQQLEDARTVVSIHDLRGRELLRALDEPLAGGRYSVRVDVSSLPVGACLVRITAGSYTGSTLMMVER